MESIAARLKSARLAVGWTAEEAGQRIEYAASTIASVENGHDKPSKRLKALLTAAYQLNSSWLETGEGEMFVRPSIEGNTTPSPLRFTDSDTAGTQPTGLDPGGLQPAGLQPSGLQPSGLQPAGLQPAGLNLAGHRANRTKGSPDREEDGGEESDNLLQVSGDFLRINYLRTAASLTWEQVGKEIGLSVGMIMMLKTAKRRMSSKSLHRLAEVEKKFGIEAYENMPLMELTKRPRETETGTLADFLRVDELPRYIARLADDVKESRKLLALAQGEVDEAERNIHLAKMAFAQKMRNQKNLSSDVARLNLPSGLQPDLFDDPLHAREMVEAAQAEVALAKEEAAYAKMVADEYKAQNEALEAQVAEYLEKKAAWEEEDRQAMIQKTDQDAHIERQIAEHEARMAGLPIPPDDAAEDKTPASKKTAPLRQAMGKTASDDRGASKRAAKGK